MSQLNADSSDDEGPLVSRSSHLNAASSDDDVDDTQAVASRSVPARRPVLDSDDDDLDHDSSQPKPSLHASSSDEEDLSTPGGGGRIRRIEDSSDEEKQPEDKENKEVEIKQSTFKNKELFDAESSDEEIENRKSKKSLLCADSSEEEELNADSSDNENIEKSKRSLAADSSSDEEGPTKSSPVRRSSQSENSDLNCDNNLEDLSPSKARKSSPKSRKSKSNALNEIRSETQRMMRESSFDLPYHRPKQRTLEEFLNRKKGTPDIVHSIKENSFSAQDETRLLEREKKLEEFYKDEEEMEQDADDEREKDSNQFHDNIEEKILVKQQSGEVDNENVLENSESVHIESSGQALENSGSQEKIEAISEPEPEKVKPLSESLDLMLEETPEIVDSSILNSSQTKRIDRQQMKLEALRKQFGDKELEQTLNLTPKLGSSSDDIFSPKNSISSGAEKLFKTFVSHVNASGHKPNDLKKENTEINVVVKKKDSEGNEVLELEKIHVDNDKKRPVNRGKKSKIGLQDLKVQLKKEVMAQKLKEMKIKAEMQKLNNEEYDELPTEEDYQPEEEDEYEGGDEEEEDSELEEEDVPIKERKSNRNLFVDDEAEDSDEDSETDSLDLVQQDDEDKGDAKSKKTPRNLKFDKEELLSDESNSQAAFDTEVTPNLETASVHSVAGSTLSSSSSIFNTVARWTPFKDRINSDQELHESMTTQPQDHQNTSPTVSQMAKKKLGFEDLFDENDPEVEDIDDIVGLCSGKFATQPANKIEMPHDQIPEFNRQATMKTQVETQDTLILTGNTDRNTTPIDEKMSGVDEILSGITSADQEKSVYPPLFEDLPDESMNVQKPEKEEDHVGGGMRILDSDDEQQDVETRILKRKRAVISDDEENEEIENDKDLNESIDEEDEDDENNEESDIENKDKDEIEEEDEKPLKAKNMFDKKGRLRKDFFEAEAELSGSEEEVSEDEDEKGLDRLELEEGDYDDIDETAERDKIGRVYQKNLIDEDQAELRLFQERFLEDGDLHTDNKRQRQFKWKGLDDSLEVERRDSDQEEEEGDDAAVENEKWRLQRLEREKWLKENSENHQEVDHTSESQFFQAAAKVIAKANSVKESSGSFTRTNSDSSGPLRPLNITKTDQRSSFLSRGQASLETLSLFAKKVDDRAGTGAKKGKNFVFTALSPEKTEQEAAPGDQGDQPASDNKSKSIKKAINPAKKQKIDRSLTSDSRSTIFNLL